MGEGRSADRGQMEARTGFEPVYKDLQSSA